MVPIDIIELVEGSFNKIASDLLGGKNSNLINLEKIRSWKMAKDKNLQSTLALNGLLWDEYGFAYKSTKDMSRLFIFFWERYKGGLYKVRIVRRGKSETKILPIRAVMKEFTQ